MNVTVNGEARVVSRAANVAQLLDELGLPAPTLLVEHNGLALRRDEWCERALSEGDHVEIIRIVAGG